MDERFLEVSDPAERENLLAFLSAAVRLDEAAVVRLRRRGEGRIAAWVTTGFDALAVRAIGGIVHPADTTAGADALIAGLSNNVDGRIELGYSMDSAWRGALPPEQGFGHVDDVPARVLIDLAQRGTALAREHGTAPVSLLDQEVLEVEGGGVRIGVSMRLVFALTAMGFVPGGNSAADGEVDLARIDSAELVRVRATNSWLRLDARFGSVMKRIGGEIPLMVTGAGR